jgi:hypothetical protein
MAARIKSPIFKRQSMNNEMHYQLGIRYIRFLFLVCLTCVACRTFADGLQAKHEHASLFDHWAIGEKSIGVTNTFGVWDSFDRRFRIICLKATRDSDPFILVHCDLKGQNRYVLGYGLRGADIKWVNTQIGEIAIVDNQVDNGINEIFVLFPPLNGANSENKEWKLLYRTPELSAAYLTVFHCYWTIKKIDPDLGTMELNGFWEFSELSNKSRVLKPVTFNIPLFFGIAKDRKYIEKSVRRKGRPDKQGNGGVDSTLSE